MELVSQAKELLDREAIRFFTPNPAQQRYIDTVGNAESFIVIFSAGNGVGKTAATAALIAAIIWPELAPKNVFASWVYQNWPYPKDFRVVSTPQEIAEGGSIQREFKRWFPKDQYAAIKGGKPYLSQYLAKDFTINLMSYDMAPEAFEGATNGLVVFNEPPPKAVFNACAARMRRGGRVLFPGTPLMDAAWIMDELVSKADGKYIALVGGDIEDNCKDHSEKGLLAHADIERMLKSYDPDELEARKSGKFMHLGGRIFKAFDRSLHVAPQEIVPANSGVAHYMVVDPAIGKPLAILWAQVDGTGTVQVYDEWPEFDFEGSKDSNLTVKDYAELIRSREGNRSIQTRILDRHFGNVRRTLGGLTLKQEFAEAGLEFVDSYHVAENVAEVETGILKVKEFLRYDRTKEMDSLNRPKLVISPKCKNTIAALERWGRDPKTSKPKEDYKDFADLTRYLVMSNPEIDTPSNWDQSSRAHYGVGNG
jgi:hypothetical protein